MKFVKMHGLGNDYVVFDLFGGDSRKAFDKLSESELKSFAKRICDRHFGIGADGILLALPSKRKGYDGVMRIVNADGSEAEMCGNGIRCIAKLLIDKGYCKNRRRELKIDTLSGIKKIAATDGMFRVDMGSPRLLRKEIPMNGKATAIAVNEPLQLKYKQTKITAVSMGNPHAVVFADDANIDIDAFDIEEMGKEIENHRVFPRRTNVEFVRVLNKGEIELRVWERGVGETLACGTGSCAAVVACALNQKTGRKVNVHLTGGDLIVEWAKDNHVYMTGPAAYVFSGAIRA
ncbi:diaminopimelate epimerase [Candidatus Woesearchaeota archaeon]|nr:diaminopimelate epimerase [Candidatus Woesearchaeota archaeon]